MKRSGRLYYVLLKISGPVLSSRKFKKCCDAYLARYTEEHVILNIGSGPQVFYGRTDIINVDSFPFAEVDMVANASELPIESEMVDCIFNMGMLEHVPDPQAIVNEMGRVIKPNGTVVVAVPFMQPFHAAPEDYYRWTPQGLRTLFSAFDRVQVELTAGPTSGMLWVMDEWLAILLSFGSKVLHDVWFLLFLILSFPLKYLDLIMGRFPNASYCASSFHVIARRKPLPKENEPY